MPTLIRHFMTTSNSFYRFLRVVSSGSNHSLLVSRDRVQFRHIKLILSKITSQVHHWPPLILCYGLIYHFGDILRCSYPAFVHSRVLPSKFRTHFNGILYENELQVQSKNQDCSFSVCKPAEQANLVAVNYFNQRKGEVNERYTCYYNPLNNTQVKPVRCFLGGCLRLKASFFSVCDELIWTKLFQCVLLKNLKRIQPPWVVKFPVCCQKLNWNILYALKLRVLYKILRAHCKGDHCGIWLEFLSKTVLFCILPLRLRLYKD